MLTDRELEVLRLVALGHTNSEIASKMYISPRTVETHRANLQSKLGITGRPGARALRARARGHSPVSTTARARQLELEAAQRRVVERLKPRDSARSTSRRVIVVVAAGLLFAAAFAARVVVNDPRRAAGELLRGPDRAAGDRVRRARRA